MARPGRSFNAMAETQHRYYVIPADGGPTTGYDNHDVAVTVAREYGDGAHVVDTMAMPYHPMAERIENGDPVYCEYGGWDIRGGADVNLIEAAKKGYPPLARAFLAKGAEVNAVDRNGATALIWAVAGRSPDLVTLLIDHGADVNMRDLEGLSALDLAKRKNLDDIAAMLQAAGAAD
jgi:hypothetical protein